jgi:hypothetical protein
VQLVVWAVVGLFISGCAAFSSRTVATPEPALMGHITLAWDDFDNVNRKVGGYYLYYWQSDWDEPKRVDVGLETSYTLENLEAGRLYTFAVTAHDGKGGGESVYSNVVKHRISAQNMRDVPRF